MTSMHAQRFHSLSKNYGSSILSKLYFAQSADAVEYTDCTSAEG